MGSLEVHAAMRRAVENNVDRQIAAIDAGAVPRETGGRIKDTVRAAPERPENAIERIFNSLFGVDPNA